MSATAPNPPMLRRIRSPISGCSAHDLALLGRQRPGLVEDRVGDADLADVVQQRRGADDLDLAARQSERARHARGHLDDGLRVLAGVAIAFEQRDGERLDGVALVDRGDDRGAGGLARRRGHDAPAAGRDRVGKGMAGALEQVDRTIVTRQRRHADGDRKVRDRSDLDGVDVVEQPPNAARGVLGAGVAEQQRELGVPDAAEHVLPANAGPQRGDHGAQRRVAGGEAVRAHQFGDAVELQQDKRRGAVVAMGAADLVGEPVAEGLHRAQPGERIAAV